MSANSVLVALIILGAIGSFALAARKKDPAAKRQSGSAVATNSVLSVLLLAGWITWGVLSDQWLVVAAAFGPSLLAGVLAGFRSVTDAQAKP